jgi:hypothetical protein
VSELPAIPTDRANALLSGGGFLKRVKVLQGLSKEVNQKKGTPGDFCHGFGDQLINLGGQFQAVVGPYRPHALHLMGREVEAESFDDQSEVFKKIERRANLRKNQREEDESAMFGLDFLFWFPGLSQYGVFFFAKTARENAKPLLSAAGKLVTIKAVLTETPKFSWFKPQVMKAEDVVSTDPTHFPTKDQRDNAIALFEAGSGGGDDDAPEGSQPTASRPR